MAYAWSAELETGNATIDSQHKQLITAINNLLDACNSGKGRAEVEKTVVFLRDYTHKHFGDEERLQQQSRYPDYVNHKRLHDGFTKNVEDIVAQAKREGASIALVGRVNGEVGSWLINHIKKEDVKVAAHVKSAGK